MRNINVTNVIIMLIYCFRSARTIKRTSTILFSRVSSPRPSAICGPTCAELQHTHELAMLMFQLSSGMYEFWHELLQGEEESPTIRFKGETPRYSWKQNAETIEVSE